MGIIQHFVRPRPTEDAPPPPILGLTLTSALYPVLVEGDAVSMSGSVQAVDTYTFFGLEEVTMSGAVPSAPVLTATIVYTTYANWPLEAVSMAGVLPSAPVLTATIIYTSYTNWPLEGVSMSGSVPSAPVLTVTIQFVNYTNWTLEEVSMAGTVQGVTLA